MSDPKDTSNDGAAERVQAGGNPLAEGGPLDRVRRLAELKPVDPKLVAERLVMLFHAEIGGVARALSVVDKAAARDVAEQIRIAVAALSAELAERGPRAELPGPPLIEDRVVKKTREVLMRERIIMLCVTVTDRELQSKDILKEVRKGEPDIKDATLTATLDRLTGDGLLVRERKGRYRNSPKSREYLAVLEQEIDRFGEL